MWCSSFKKRYFWFPLLLTILLLAGCNGVIEDDATTQAVIEQLVSTSTPTPEPTEPPTATSTPIPPTNTSEPPTEIPPAATFTPEPGPPSAPDFVVQDDPNDSYNCDTMAVVNDLEVDIATIIAVRQETTLLIRVLMNNPLATDFSFAVLLGLFKESDSDHYMWEVHDGVERSGKLDPLTGELLTPSDSNLLIEHNQAAGEVAFSIPISSTAVISGTAVISSTGTLLNQLHVASFHTPQEGQPKNCDTAGPYEFPPAFN